MFAEYLELKMPEHITVKIKPRFVDSKLNRLSDYEEIYFHTLIKGKSSKLYFNIKKLISKNDYEKFIDKEVVVKVRKQIFGVNEYNIISMYLKNS